MPILGNGLIRRRSGYVPTYLLRDEFVTDESAPLASPRTAEPGPGTWTIVDTGNKLAISDGKLSNAGNSGNGDPRFYGESVSRIAGRTLVGKTIFSSISGFSFGWHANSSDMGKPIPGWIGGGGGDSYLRTAEEALIFELGISNNNNWAIVLRSTGALMFRDLVLVWVDGAGSTSPLFPGMGARTSTPSHWIGTLDNFCVVDLPAPFDTDFGLATQRIASATAGATATAEANALVEFTWTAATGETLELDVRRTDDDNRWILRCAQAGSTIKLIERNAGVETERASAAQTWTNGTAYRIVAIVDGNVIRTFVATIAKSTYSSATFNNTATGVKVSHAGTDLVCWPRTLSGAALAILEAVSA
jgi:hypothetical protein